MAGRKRDLALSRLAVLPSARGEVIRSFRLRTPKKKSTTMHLTLRDWIKLTGTAALGASLPDVFGAAQNEKLLIRDNEQPLFNLPEQIKDPVKIESIEMLKSGTNFFVRTRSTNGAVGIIQTKQAEPFIPIFEHLVAPQSIGKDARDLEQLIDDAYRENYKLAGLAFWSPVAYVEHSL